MRCRSPSTRMRASSFLLSVCSPVLHRMLCGSFMESSDKRLDLQDVDGSAFGKALDLCCGKVNGLEMELDEVRVLATGSK